MEPSCHLPSSFLLCLYGQKSPRALFCTGFSHHLGKPYSSIFHTRLSRQQQSRNFMQRKHVSVKTLNEFPKLNPSSTPIPASTPNSFRTSHQKKHLIDGVVNSSSSTSSLHVTALTRAHCCNFPHEHRMFWPISDNPKVPQSISLSRLLTCWC